MLNIPSIIRPAFLTQLSYTLSELCRVYLFTFYVLYSSYQGRQDQDLELIIYCWHPLKTAILLTTLMVYSKKAFFPPQDKVSPEHRPDRAFG